MHTIMLKWQFFIFLYSLASFYLFPLFSDLSLRGKLGQGIFILYHWMRVEGDILLLVLTLHSR
jgi:hypothetical protein